MSQEAQQEVLFTFLFCETKLENKERDNTERDRERDNTERETDNTERSKTRQKKHHTQILTHIYTLGQHTHRLSLSHTLKRTHTHT